MAKPPYDDSNLKDILKRQIEIAEQSSVLRHQQLFSHDLLQQQTNLMKEWQSLATFRQLNSTNSQWIDQFNLLKQQNMLEKLDLAKTMQWIDQFNALKQQGYLATLFDFKWFDSFRLGIADFGRKIADVGSRAFDAFLTVSPYIVDSLNGFHTLTETWLNERIVATLKHYHWWYVPSMPRNLVMEVCDLADTGNGRSVHAHICNYYKENDYKALCDLVSKWYTVPYFAKRRKIIDSALHAHIRRDYVSSIPTLLPQIEGIAQDFLRDLGLYNKLVNWNVVVEVVGGVPSPPRVVLVESFADALNEIFFSGFSPSQESFAALINRNTILHGRNTRYGLPANSLRCFLMLETQFYYLNAILQKHTVSELQSQYKAVMQKRSQNSGKGRPSQ